MVRLRLFTLPTCPKCPAAKEITEAILKNRNDITLEILDISDVNNMTAALMLQISSTPSFVIDNTPLFISDVPSLKELDTKIDEYKRRIAN
ncbi:MAG: thioredoxin family protein [Candidatus Bathyarchaeota archaeon]